MLRYLAVLFVFFISSEMISQKTLEKTFDVGTLSSIVLQADGVHAINISSEARENIIITTEVQGETYENVVLDIVESETELIVTPGLTPFFVPENDKLAAHKVLAIEISILVPEGFTISIVSNIAHVLGQGNYKRFETSLDEGHCMLTQFLGDATLLSKSGSITVSAFANVRAKKVSSKRGKVINRLPKGGRFAVVAESISGDITLEQTK